MQLRHKTFRTSRLEQLEARQVLAGNVTAAVYGGTLFITGDNAGNGILITQDLSSGVPVAGKFTVTGVTQDGSATTVNGALSKTVSGVTGDVIIDLRRGNDRVAITNGNPTIIQTDFQNYFTGTSLSSGPATTITLPRNLFVDLGDGNDQFATDAVHVRGDAILHGGEGNNDLGLLRTTIDGSYIADSGSGADRIGAVLTSIGRDEIIHTGSGADLVGLGGESARFALVDTGAGADQVNILNSQIRWDLVVILGEGNDTATLTDTSVGKQATVDGGSGNDNITFNRLHVTDNLFAFLGSGDDTICIGGTSAKRLHLDGGSGSDSYLIDSTQANSFGTVKKFGIETVGSCQLSTTSTVSATNLT
jgi:hypothetical protein